MGWLRAFIALTFLAVQTTSWGGAHVQMTVTPGGADLEFDCAVGTITETVPNTDGAFRLKGTFTPQSSGPTRGDGPKAAAAIYAGAIDRDSMTLHIAVEGRNEELGPFSLARGDSGTLRKCR